MTDGTGLDEVGRVVLAELAWGVEEYHRGPEPFTGVGRCQARMAGARRNHTGWAIRASVRLGWHRFTTGVSGFEAEMRVIRDAVRAYLARPTLTLPRPATA